MQRNIIVFLQRVMVIGSSEIVDPISGNKRIIYGFRPNYSLTFRTVEEDEAEEAEA